ncbi:2-octaprenyl-6-methoxyphenyl hydroxylase [Aureimonas ureilytica]|uniref:2-octaprenyl-6-methoxyphenyl hydroxylase n=1 Tax=Aureimonas ureilytica TaxID=401562 RepID=A0A175R7A9_9HYPH|nr:UbiH/UbiF family hydroxylase [Aureimonas ureilytica]KTQ95090.1 2-octaprenyl-6-methoxyphenyl hydroxylase [Aureimonas ureilytica]
MTEIRREVAVIGGGLVGYGAALGLAKAGFETILIAPQAPDDRRSTALIGSSLDFLATCGLIGEIERAGEPLRVMRIIDDTMRLFRAPNIEFHASEIDRDAFGINILNADLMRIFRAAASAMTDRLTVISDAVTSIDAKEDHAHLTLSSGEMVRTGLVVGADGRRSRVRESAGISVRNWSYPQSAIVLNFGHQRDHDGVSTEFHTRTGPFTQVPLPGRRSSLVWVERPETADLIVSARPDRLSRMIEDRLHSILGAVEVEGEAQSFPLSGAAASRFGAERRVLVGEAAHVFPPIGAQGLNLGLRDAIDLIKVAERHRDDLGGRRMTADYDRARGADIATRTAAVDLLNRSLLSGFLPVQLARSAGVSLLSRLPLLRRTLMREGVEPGSSFRLPARSARRDDRPSSV